MWSGKWKEMIHGRHLVIFSGTKAITDSNYQNLIPGQTGPQTTDKQAQSI